MKSRKVRLGISVGDINGIGLEVIMKAFSDRNFHLLGRPLVEYKKLCSQFLYMYLFQITCQIHLLFQFFFFSLNNKMELGKSTDSYSSHFFINMRRTFKEKICQIVSR